jgi:hypothetical protein
VLAVPLAAVSAGADGSSRVEVDNGDDTTTVLKVTTGLSAEGFVEIRPGEARLDAGDRVVVGRDLLLPGEVERGDNDGDADDGGGSEGEALGSGGGP